MNMTHQQKLEAVRQKCIVANPEIVELKFGCAYRVAKRPGTFVVTSDHMIETINGMDITAIGRPVRLADVLNAIMHTDHVVCIASNERFEVLDKEKNEWIPVFETWLLCADDLSMQSEATIDFLYELLK